MTLKFYFIRRSMPIILFLAAIFSNQITKAQQTLSVIGGWNTYVHLPWDYDQNPTKTYPTIVFFPGIGEVGTSAPKVIANGPGAYIAQGWNGNVLVGTDSVKFIVISMQPAEAWPPEVYINSHIQQIKNLYRVDGTKLHITGLSHGGWCSTTFVTGDAAAGPYTYASQAATVVEVEGVQPNDNAPYPNLFDNFAKAGGRLLAFEQKWDFRDAQTRVTRMNNTRANSAVYVQTNFGSGGHCCWSEFYGGGGKAPGVFLLDGVNQNLYQWMARNPLNNIAPIVNAGRDTLIAAPVANTMLRGTATDPDGTVSSYTWTKISGPLTFTIANTATATTAITNLLPGTYKFELKAWDNRGTMGKDTVTIANGAGLLPVVLSNFTAVNRNNVVQLQWNTSLEINSDHFEVERKTTGLLFEKIGTVATTGRVNGNTYLFNDGLPEKGTNQYRLKMVDRDTHAEYSRIVTVNIKDAQSFSVSNVHLSAATGMLQMIVNSSKIQSANLVITDAGGRTLLQSACNLQKGMNNILKQLSLNAKGIYYVKILTPESFVVTTVLSNN